MELLRLEIISAISLRSFGEMIKNNNNKKIKQTQIPTFPWKFLTCRKTAWSSVKKKKVMKCPNLCMKQSEWVMLLCSPAPCEGFAEPRALLLPAGKVLGVWTFERVPRSLHVENQNNLLAKRSNQRHKKDNPTPTSSQMCNQWSPAPWPTPELPSPSQELRGALVLKRKKRGSFLW